MRITEEVLGRLKYGKNVFSIVFNAFVCTLKSNDVKRLLDYIVKVSSARDSCGAAILFNLSRITRGVRALSTLRIHIQSLSSLTPRKMCLS